MAGRQGMGGHGAGTGFDPAQVAGKAAAPRPRLLVGAFTAMNTHVGRGDGRLHGGGDLQNAAPAAAHHRDLDVRTANGDSAGLRS